MKMTFTTITSLCSLALAIVLTPVTATAGVTNIAQLPLLSMDDTGAVKPNLMLLYDNSGSMAYTFTPDYIDDGSTCRKKLVMSSGTTGCSVGHPPFNSADFNKQYYDPKVRYLPPVRADGTSYDSQTRAVTTNWTVVLNDAFNVANDDLAGNNNSKSINLVTGFPDLAWCDVNVQNCVFNTATYSYPNDDRYTAGRFYSNPYYYEIKVAEYCTDVNMKTCVTTTVGAPAPTGYPVAAKVRWCDSNKLTNCQAKYVGNFKYPRFSTPNAAVVAAYGTITIGASNYAGSLSIDSVSVVENTSTVVITNGAVNAAAGTNTPAKQASMANAVAASIIAKTGLTNQYTACVRTPTGSVPSCASFGITLGSDNIVAVVPIECVPGATTKQIGQCSLLADATRNGWAITVQAPTAIAPGAKPATAVITMGGAGKKNSNTTLGASTLGGTSLFSSITFNKDANSDDAAKSVAAAINNNGNSALTAIQGGKTGCSSGASTVCVSTTVSYADGQKFAFGGFGNNNNLTISGTNTTGGAAPQNDAIPVSATKIGAGSAIFVRVDIVPERTTYPRADKRSDCAAAGSCTYDEEMTNFANWYTYYKTRNQTMKTSVGLAFKPLTENYNVGLVALSTAASTSGKINRPLPFSGDVRTNWYKNLYAMTLSGSTPLRPALNNVGKMYANRSPYVANAKEEAVQFPCQQNFTFLTTDGYWNGDGADGVTDNDNKNDAARFCTKGTGCVDDSGKNANSLADVALYWYNGGSADQVVSLRPTLENMNEEGKVRGPAGDNRHLHMNTYTLGLGVDGVMNYEENYDTAPASGGDFSNLINGVTTGCPWNNNGPYVWPDAVTTDNAGGATYQTRVDDLWHAAINGRGKYFSASDPTQVIAGLSAALSNIAAHVGAASSAATSTPNISAADNDIFSSTFTTVQWSGELTDKKIDVVTGNISTKPDWNTSNVLGLRVGPSTDTRVIKMLDTANGGLKNFNYAAMTALEKSWFDNKCSAMAQCNNLTPANRAIVNQGATVIGWLRGQQQYADDVILRAYGKSKEDANVPVILGDIASSKPAYVRQPRKSFATAGYAEFVTAQATRAPAVYVGANDGMLHAFNAATGDENWAYVPRITMKKLYAQAGSTYGTNHQFTADGSPEVGDVKIKGVWKSVLVAGLNGGGRGYYALDVTDPANPVGLWETCADATICTGVNNEPEMGLTFGNPQTGLWKDSVGNLKWVVFVTSGYNNIPGTDGVAGGTGKGWLMVLDIETGKVLAKTSTGSGDTATPSGLARLTAISADPAVDPLATYIYSGDILGQMWRFDLTAGGAPTVIKMGDAGTLQPITARPDVTYCKANSTDANGVVTSTNKIMVAFGTGRLLDIGDVANVDKQSVYVLRDSGVGITSGQWRNNTNMVKRTITKTTTNNVDVYKSSGAVVDLTTQLGWYADFDANAGERVNLDPRIAAGSLNVVTNIPASSNACSVGGKSNLYTFDVCDGSGNADGVVGGTLSNTSAAVGFIEVTLPNGAKEIIVNLADGSQEKKLVDDKKDPVSRRTGWRRIRN